MSARKMKCPHRCGADVGIDSGDSDPVEYTCDNCGGEFTAGEARQGRMYVRDRKIEARLANLESRIASIERGLSDVAFRTAVIG